MSDIFVSVVAIVPKPSGSASPGTPQTPGSQDIAGIHSEIQKNRVATPGAQPK